MRVGEETVRGGGGGVQMRVGGKESWRMRVDVEGVRWAKAGVSGLRSDVAHRKKRKGM